MSAQRHIGLVGFGAIGRDVGRYLAAGNFRLTVLLREGSAARDALPPGLDLVGTVEELVDASPDLVVEAAGQAALAAMAPVLIGAGISVVAAATGALGDEDLIARLTGIAARSGARLIVPAGAIGGLDYLAAVRMTGDARVRYTSRKPPAAWAAELAAVSAGGQPLREPVVLFEGGAQEAARLYPRNLNAGLTVALAAGVARTRVRAIADPAATRNTHKIEVESALGSATLCFTNTPSATNPKTSALTAASLAAAVHRHFAPLIV
ncbi:aspartate dehydrogenase [Chelatococcus sp. GCM10030263]|uniref:aspartate dehydrogenase n=1 Tax=Chelatococcus sp. GCM10030263 TaxID=3273387 RepID=UPI0036240147